MGIIRYALRVLAIIITNFITAFLEFIVPPRRKSIKGETVLITGGGHGIGRELALEISKLETTVVVWDINKESCEKTVEDVKKNGGNAYAYQCDVRSSSEIKDVASRVRKDVGEISILINNAGILNGAPLLDLDEAEIRRTFEVNILAHFWMIREFLPYMKSKDHGHILNLCSMSSFSGTANLTDYSASKYAALGFSESLIEELAEQGHTGIRVSCMCPLFVDTGMVKNIVVQNKLTKLLTPNEVALAAIDGMLRNYEIITLPAFLWLIVKIGSLMPRRTLRCLKIEASMGILTQCKKEN